MPDGVETLGEPSFFTCEFGQHIWIGRARDYGDTRVALDGESLEAHGLARNRAAREPADRIT